MKLQLAKDTTSVILTVFIQDSSSGVGAGLGSLDETSSIAGGFVRMGSTGTAVAVDENVTTEGTYEAPSTEAHIRIGTPANMRTGIYELHLHNNLPKTGADYVTISLGGATNMADLIIEIQLTNVNLNDGVRGGMTALPNAAADAAGGVPISDAGGLDLDTKLANTNEVTAARMGALTDWINGGRLDLLLDAILADTGTDGVVLANNAITAAKIATDAIAAAEISAAAANKIADHIIRRGFEAACDSSDGDTKSFRSLLGAMAKLVNKVVISGGVLTAYEDDDATSLGSQTITTDENAVPIVGVDTD